MSKFLYHEACPQCGSKDNLGVWEDGHKWCFGCKYYEHGQVDVRHIHAPQEETPLDIRVFPTDATHYIPVEPMKWLLSCGITHTTQTHFNIQWSERQQLVCWRIKAIDGSEIGWQGRCFSPKANTKYVSYGKIHEKLCILQTTKNPGHVVLVEDYLSAIRVSDYSPCMPLFGCTINLEALLELSKSFKKVLIWLDADKLDNARKIGLNANLIGLDSETLYTYKDPKEYDNETIEELLLRKKENETL